jgi:formylglycine-generating enzyme required for sulfatase activity
MIHRSLLVGFILVLMSLLGLGPTEASDLEVTYVETSRNDFNGRPPGLNLTVSWNNSWHNERNHDAAWVFMKFNQESGYEHVYLNPGSAQMLWKGEAAMPDAALQVAEDGTGLFVHAAEPYRGPLQYHIFVEQDTSRTPFGIDYDHLEGYGIEMVYIPEGPFTLGDPDTTALDYGAYYRSGRDGGYGRLYEVTSGDEDIPVGPEDGRLFYRSNRAIYQGDQQGPIPASFPKGYNAFYLMKYEVAQGEYAAFLNTLGSSAASHRANFGGATYAQDGGSITLEDGTYQAEHLDRRNVYFHWDDMMAFADWAGLRPYTEFEYTKAARGPLAPKPMEYAWNTSSTDNLARRIDPSTQNAVMMNGLAEADLTDANRSAYGASYYWVMDLSGSMWEKVITPGDSTGRAFTGQHGDGDIDGYGFADVEEWPRGIRGASGYGYRGGGYYGGRAYLSDFVPFSPIALRRFGAWSGGPRNAAYGFRAARTAPGAQ